MVQSSFFEWAFHRYSLHRPWLPPGAFTAHALIHHQLCKHDDTFRVTEPEQEEALTFQWWAGFALLATNVLPWLAAAWALSLLGVSLPFVLYLSALAATVFAYYLAYEGFHFLMHKPCVPWIERAGFFRFLERHHRLHHVHMGRNFNVVLPLADLMTGTLLRKDPLSARPTGDGARRIARRHSRYGRRLRQEGAAAPAGPGHSPARKEISISAAAAAASVSPGAGA